MFSTLCTIFEVTTPDIYSFGVAVAIWQLFCWYTQRKQSNLPRPLAKKLVSDSSASSASDSDRSGYRARNRASSYTRSRTTERRPLKPSTSSESDRALVPSTSQVGAAPQNPHKVTESIMRFKEVLEDWGMKQKTLEGDAMSHLQDAIAGLDPNDAAIMKVLLDSKAEKGNGMRQPGRENARAGYTSGRRDSAREHAQRMKDSEASGDSLRTNLLEMASLNPATVIMVHKINHFGLDSAEVLKAYFSRFGTVECVRASHCIVRQTSGAKRLRPAAIGFLVMSKAEEAQAAIAAGEVQRVQGHDITVGIFESHSVA